MYDSPEPRRRVEREINFCWSMTPPIRGGFHDQENILVTKLDNTNQTFTVQLLEKSPVFSGPRMNDDGGSNSKFENVLKEIQSRLSATETRLSTTEKELSATKTDLSATKTDLSATETRLRITEKELNDTKGSMSATATRLSTTDRELSRTQSLLSTTEQNLSDLKDRVNHLEFKDETLTVREISKQVEKVLCSSISEGTMFFNQIRGSDKKILLSKFRSYGFSQAFVEHLRKFGNIVAHEFREPMNLTTLQKYLQVEHSGLPESFTTEQWQSESECLVRFLREYPMVDVDGFVELDAPVTGIKRKRRSFT